ncbi:Acetyltransferase, ribosomal protein N-acetylase (modular protein) [uncultured Sporomusa sp.]|uniref:Acetyltransferase, ribosomal protein N-acetylase (Modular protein) n=2 Tax=uncultured Sporomusa sp. TaxID=307249 RepID=A0A212LZA0_9FIRM|nr:Acetyltransferase, ribosomal protein N-acetylase (modular protein) [uncultured Sporomusa sp.]
MEPSKMIFHHIGKPVSLESIKDNKDVKYSPLFDMYSLNMQNDAPLPIEWHAFGTDSSLDRRIQTEPHIAFKVNDIAAVLIGQEIVMPLYEPFSGYRCAMIQVSGVLIELIETSLPEEKIWHDEETLKNGVLYGGEEKNFELESERLRFRKITAEDFDLLKELLGNPAVMYAWEHTFSDEQVRDWIQKQLTYYVQDGVGYFAVHEKSTGAFVGQMGLHRFVLDNLKGFEVCYMLAPHHWKKGYAIEGVRRLEAYACEELRLRTLYAQVKTNNQASVVVAEKAGFVKQLKFTKYYNGKAMEHFLYVKTLTGYGVD